MKRLPDTELTVMKALWNKGVDTPRSPFSTPLSGSAREIRLRLVGIFQWKKQRPPMPLLCLCLAAALLCGGLTGCERTAPSGQGGALEEESWSTQTILDALPCPQELFDSGVSPSRTLLEAMGDEPTFAAAWFADSYPRYSLTMGLVNRDVEVLWESICPQEAAPLKLDDAPVPRASLTCQPYTALSQEELLAAS